MIAFQTADYVLMGMTVAAAILGLFGGFSGALGFCAGFAAAGAAVRFGHPLAAHYLSSPWADGLAMLVLSLLAFGIARALVKRVVKGLLAQPADAILGSLVAAVTGSAVSLAAVYALVNLAAVPVESALYQLLMGQMHV